jgi:hypothetical protein
MSIPIHTIEIGDGSTFARTDRILMWRLTGIANASGSAGAAVTTAVSIAPGVLPASYDVDVFDTGGQNCFGTVTNKTNTGFNGVLQPPAGVALAAGTFNLVIVG